MKYNAIDKAIRETIREPETATNEQFVRHVMTRLPRRRSAVERLRDGVIAFVLSPLFLLSVLVAAVSIFWQPMLALLAEMPEMPTSTLLVLLATGMGFIAYISYQMVCDLKSLL